MARRLIASGVGALLIVLGASAAAAQDLDQYYGQPVSEIRFQVEGLPTPPASLAAAVEVGVGRSLTREDVRESVVHLSARYDQVFVVVAPAPGGVLVTFRLVPRYPINNVVIAPGDVGVSPGALRTELRQRFIGVSTGFRIDAVEEAARHFLNDAGYLSATVLAATKVEPDASRATLVVSVSAGPLALIRRSEVRGATLITAEEVQRRAESLPGRPFRRRQIEIRIAEIEDDLRARGYYEAQVAVLADPTPEGVDVAIAIDAGPRVEVRVEPSLSALPGRLDDLIPVKRLRSADQDLLEDAKARIERALRRQGYANASAPFQRDPGPDGATLFITFVISRGTRHFVDSIDFTRLPASVVPLATARESVAVKPGEVFDEERFIAGVQTLTEAYRRLGYYRASAEPARELVAARSTPAEAWVILDPNLTVGPRGVVTEVSFEFQGAHQVPDADLRARLQSTVGAPYIELDAVRDQDAVVALYRERGYLSATVALNARFTEDGTGVVLAFTISEGPRVVIGRVTVTGNEQLSEQQILEVLELAPGQPLSPEAVSAARQRLYDMEVFRTASVNVEEQLSGETEAHVLVNVIEPPRISGGFGAGLEGGTFPRAIPGGGFEDRIDLRPRGSFEISRRNIGGRNRTLSFFSRVSIRPRADTTDAELDPSGLGFAEHRVTGTYRERRAFKTNTDLLLSVTSEQAVRSSYTSLRQGINAEFLRRPTVRVSISGRYGLDFTRLSNVRVDQDEQPLIDRLFPQVRLSFVASGVSWDSRDSILAATRGSSLTADAEVAARVIGSEVGYVKTFFSASHFRRIRPSSPTVLGTRMLVGLATGFERTVTSATGEASVVDDLPVSQRFFAGGSTTVRGFQFDRLGIFNANPGPDCVPVSDCSVIDATTTLSFGGNSMVVLNAELRRTMGKLLGSNWGVAGFIDAGNVFPRTIDFNLAKIRGAVGAGLRWDTPLGPVRLDFGFKLDRLVINEKRESGWQYHLSIGEAF